MKILFFDLETTGVNPERNAIHQISGFIEVDKERVHTFNLQFRPDPSKVIEAEALKVSGLTEEDLANRDISHTQAFLQFVAILGLYVGRFDKQDKFFLCGYNNAAFDNQFLRAFFDSVGDKYFGSWFWSSSIDVMVLASLYLAPIRHRMKDFKLATVATTMGIEVDQEKTHDALYDVGITKAIFDKCMAKWYAPRQAPIEP